MKNGFYNLLRSFFTFSTVVAAVWIPLPLYLQIIVTALMFVAIYMLFDLMQKFDKSREIVDRFAQITAAIALKQVFQPEEEKENENAEEALKGELNEKFKYRADKNS